MAMFLPPNLATLLILRPPDSGFLCEAGTFSQALLWRKVRHWSLFLSGFLLSPGPGSVLFLFFKSCCQAGKWLLSHNCTLPTLEFISQKCSSALGSGFWKS